MLRNAHGRWMLSPRFVLGGYLLPLVFATVAARPDCPEETLLNADETGEVPCSCFIQGEEAGVTLAAPANHYPIEILRVGILWKSAVGSALDTLETGIHVYAGGLPDPGTPIQTFNGPTFSDGSINEFDLEPLAGEARIESGPFTVTVEFLNTQPSPSSLQAPFTPTVVADAAASGCRAGRNVVFTGGSWTDACLQGVNGDWVMQVVYRRLECGPQLPGDCNQDGTIDLSDGVSFLNWFFQGVELPAPAGSELCLTDPAGATAVGLQIMDWNGDGVLDLSDGSGLLTWFFGGTAEHELGQACILTQSPDCISSCVDSP